LVEVRLVQRPVVVVRPSSIGMPGEERSHQALVHLEREEESA
jgi:hypothetical protein